MKYLFTVIFILAFQITHAQVFNWVKQISSLSSDSYKEIKIDNNNNVISIGRFDGTVDFDPGSSVYNITGSGNENTFIQKLSNSGNLVWASAIVGYGANDAIRGISVEIDQAGNIYVVGFFKGTIDFDPSSNTNNITSSGNADIFILKLNVNGNLIWVKTIGNTNYDYANSIAIDKIGDVYITGFFGGTVDFNPSSNVYNLTSLTPSNFSAYVLKLDSTSSFKWARKIGGSGTSNAEGISICVDTQFNTYITGLFYATVDFDPGGNTHDLTSNGGTDIFVEKLDQNGNFSWVIQIGGTQNEGGNKIAADTFGNLYLTGYFYSSGVDFDPGNGTSVLSNIGGQDMFCLKMDLMSNFKWVSHIGSIGDDAGSFCTDNLGGLYVTGSFNGTVDFDPGSKIRSMTSFGANGIINTNAFIQYLDSTGNLIWFKTFLGLSINSFSASSNSFSNTIAKNSNNDIFIAGHFNGTIDANPGLDTNKITEYGWPGNINNLSDAYLIKLRNVEVCSTTNKCGIYRQNDSCYADYPYTDAKNSDCVVYQNTKCSNPDAWDFCRYNCTSWVAWCINKAHGYTDTIKTNQHFFSDYKVNNIPTHLGPAIDWLPALFKLGYKVDNSPQVGAIAWWNNHKNDPDGGGGIGVDGHVAYVSCVKGDSVTLTEFNFSPFCYYDIRIVDNSLPFKAGNRKPDSFIHIESSPVGLLDNNTPEKIQIYPNPTDGIVNLKIEVTTNTAIRIEILNIIGKKEYELSGYSTKMGYSTIISFTNLANGVYFLQLYTNNNIFTKKIIVQR